MAKQFGEIIKDVDTYALELGRLIPDTMKAFGEISRTVQRTGTLNSKTKELMALAIAVSGQCDACIAYHARGAGKAGASRQEVAETLAVAIQMGGGPAVNYATDALRAFDELARHATSEVAA
jgi:AhpD family alkylhydroperoxidase